MKTLQRALAFCQSCSCQGGMGKWRRPRPVSRHASVMAAGFWGPRRSALGPWLCRGAKPEHTLGPGATVGVLGTGVPRLAFLRPRAWLIRRPGTAQPHQQPLKTLVRGRASRGVRRKTSPRAASLGWLLRCGYIKARGTSRGPRDVSSDDQGHVGASGRRVLDSSLVPKE